MQKIIAALIAKGYGKDFIANILRKGLTSLSAIVGVYLSQAGVAPDTVAGFSSWLIALAPIVVAFVWEILEKKFAASVTTAALAAPAGATLADAKAEAVAKIAAK